jgi:hypothetical protein
MFSFFQQSTPKRNYIPDSIYTVCGEDCTICSNEVYSPVVKGMVHDTLSGKVFCPFGKGESMNQTTYSDQFYLNQLNKLPATTWGRVPQLEPRPLAQIGLEWRTS